MKKYELCIAISQQIFPKDYWDKHCRSCGARMAAKFNNGCYSGSTGVYCARRPKPLDRADATNYYESETACALLRTMMLKKLTLKEWFDLLVRGFCIVGGKNESSKDYRAAQVMAAAQWLKIEYGTLED